MTTHYYVLPTELIYQILCHADPRDVIRWRTVSKWFHAITCDATFWRALYENTPFPCPSGPFQSTAFLERTLVRSAVLAQSWTTRPVRDVSSVRVQLEGKSAIPLTLIRGRWIVSCELKRRFVLHDVEPAAEARTRHVLWEGENIEVSSWCVSVKASVEGQCVVYVLLSYKVHLADRDPLPWKLLEFRLNDQSGELYDSAAVDPPGFTYSHGMRLHGGKSPFLIIQAWSKFLLFDTRARVFRELPEFRIALDETIEEIGHNSQPRDIPSRMVFTDTHIISFCHVQRLSYKDYRTVIQVFALPPHQSPVESGNPTLRLTHEGIVRYHVSGAAVLKPSVDPVTGATNARLLVYNTATRCRDSQVASINLTLPEPSSVGVSPMTVEVQPIAFPTDGALSSRYEVYFQYIGVSDDGHVRGFHRGILRRHIVDPVGNNHIRKFTIDTTRDQWIITCGKFSPAEWSHLKDAWADKFITFDAMRGRLCLVDPKNYKTVFVVDIE